MPPPAPPSPAALPRRIVFTGDFLRMGAKGGAEGRALRPTQHENIRWLAQLLGAPLGLACALPREVVHWDPDWVSGARIETATVRAIYEALWLPPRIESWARLFAAETLPPAVEALLVPLFAQSLVVGFELPPWLTRFLDRQGLVYVDCAISPIRFMDDLLIELSSNHPALAAAARPHAVPEALIRLQAGMVSAHAAIGLADPPRPGTLLLLLQTSHDKVVIHEGRFTSLPEHLERLQQVAAGYAQVLIREHPLQAQPRLRDELLARLPGARLTGENFYRLLGHPNLAGVAALSSSGVAEAAWFGKAGHYLLPGYRPGAMAPSLPAITLGDAILGPDFWRDLLAALGLPVTAHDGLRLPVKPNRLRLQLRAAWGYNRIDTDIAAGWARE